MDLRIVRISPAGDSLRPVYVAQSASSGIGFRNIGSDWYNPHDCAAFIRDNITELILGKDIKDVERFVITGEYSTLVEMTHYVNIGFQITKSCCDPMTTNEIVAILENNQTPKASAENPSSDKPPEEPAKKATEPSSSPKKDLTYSSEKQFEGTYGSHRNKEYVQQKLKEVAAILDDLAENEGIACVMIGADDFEQNDVSTYVPMTPKSDRDVWFFKNVITPIIEKRLELRKKWFKKQDAKMGFTLSA